MAEQHPLTISVNGQCAIDAGYWQECVEEDQTPYRLVSPSQTTMYRQVLSYLEETTSDEKVPPRSQLRFGEVAIATVALCIRWGSYFAVLTNRDLPQCRLTKAQETLLMQETAELFVPTMRALYQAVSKPSEQIWPE